MIELSHVTLRRTDHSSLLSNFNLRVRPGELVVLVGGSGTGKTTILQLLTGEAVPSEGTISIGDTEVTALRNNALALHRRSIGILSDALHLLADRTVEENLALPLDIMRMPSARKRERLEAICTRFRITELRRSFPRGLSMSEQQRVAIARAVIAEPLVLLADEPAAHLDLVGARNIAELFEHENMRGMTVLLATRDEQFARMLEKARTVTL